MASLRLETKPIAEMVMCVLYWTMVQRSLTYLLVGISARETTNLSVSTLALVYTIYCIAQIHWTVSFCEFVVKHMQNTNIQADRNHKGVYNSLQHLLYLGRYFYMQTFCSFLQNATGQVQSQTEEHVFYRVQ